MKSRKGLAEIVSYVLLIVFAVSISALVYTWLRGTIPKAETTCPEAVSIEIRDYTFFTDNTNKKYLFINVTNRGLFSVNGLSFTLKEDGTLCKIEQLDCADFDKCDLLQANKIMFGSVLNQSQIKPIGIMYSGCDEANEVEIIPIKFVEKNLVLCENSVIKQKLK